MPRMRGMRKARRKETRLANPGFLAWFQQGRSRGSTDLFSKALPLLERARPCRTPRGSGQAGTPWAGLP